MKWTAAALGLAATAVAMPQAASDNLKPDGGAPDGCSANYDGQFEVSIFQLGNAKRDLMVRLSQYPVPLLPTAANTPTEA